MNGATPQHQAQDPPPRPVVRFSYPTDPQHVPTELAELRHWVAWQWEKRDGDMGGANELRRQLAAFEKYVQDKKTHDVLAAESRRTEILIGHLLGPPNPGQRTDLLPAGKRFEVPTQQGQRNDLNFSPAGEKFAVASNDAYKFRLLAKYEARVEEWLNEGLVSRTAILGLIKRLEERPSGTPQEIALASWEEWLPRQPDCDLLLTDPPYMTDIDGSIEEFAQAWLRQREGQKDTPRQPVEAGA